MQDPIAAPPTMPRNSRRCMMTSPLIPNLPRGGEPGTDPGFPGLPSCKGILSVSAPAGRIPGCRRRLCSAPLAAALGLLYRTLR